MKRAIGGRRGDRRSEERNKQLEEKLVRFSERLEQLQPREQKSMASVLQKLGALATINDQQFEDLGEALLTAVERGRLQDLVDEISGAEEITEDQLLQILIEANVLQALNLAEVIRTKITTVKGLEAKILAGELEAAVRDFVR